MQVQVRHPSPSITGSQASSCASLLAAALEHCWCWAGCFLDGTSAQTWQQMEAVSWSVIGQEPCLGSLLLPRTTSLQTGVVSSCPDFGMLVALAKFSTAQHDEHKAYFYQYHS